MNAHGYQQYQQQVVNTMTKSEMLLLLMDEMLKRLSKANYALEKGDDALFHQSVIRTRDITTYLMDTLNFKYPISRELHRMYDFFLYDLSRLDAGRNPQIIVDLKGLIQELRDAFAEAAKISGM